MQLLLADDHVLFREALLQFITALKPEWSITAVGDFDSAYDLLSSGKTYDLVLLDLRMPGMHGMSGIKKMTENHPDQYVSILSGVAEEEHIRQAMSLGSRAYFPKTLNGKTLVRAIELVVLSKQKFVPMDETGIKVMPSYYDDGDFSDKIPELTEIITNKDMPNLTKREIDVLTRLAKGLSNKDIAEDLSIKVSTVKLHVGGICKKLNVENRTQAAIKAHNIDIDATIDVTASSH